MDIAPRTAGEARISLTPVTREAASALGSSLAAMDPWARYPYSPEALARYLFARELSAPRYAIHAGETLVGAIGLQRDWLRGPYIQFLAFLPEAQGKGYGTRILQWCEEQAVSSQARSLWVAASDFNADAIRFYERFGFQCTAVLDDVVKDGFNEVLMRKKLV
jgi:GNAT superfamily N-acetyltransferase